MVPACGAFGSWWQVATRATAWETEAHRHKSKFCIVVKGRIVDVEPGAQASTTRVAPWNARRMHPRAGCLADDQNPCAFGRRDYRAWGMRQGGCADRAGADVTQQGIQRGSLHNSHVGDRVTGANRVPSHVRISKPRLSRINQCIVRLRLLAPRRDRGGDVPRFKECSAVAERHGVSSAMIRRSQHPHTASDHTIAHRIAGREQSLVFFYHRGTGHAGVVDPARLWGTVDVRQEAIDPFLGG